MKIITFDTDRKVETKKGFHINVRGILFATLKVALVAAAIIGLLAVVTLASMYLIKLILGLLLSWPVLLIAAGVTIMFIVCS